MAKNILDDYIVKSYQRWLDYALFHATHAHITDQAQDVLNEVLASILEKDRAFILSLLKKKKSGYTELDYYILRMIKLNCHSITSPYRHAYKTVHVDANKDPWKLEIIDDDQQDPDAKSIRLKKFQQMREILDSLNLSKKEKDIFSWKFFHDNNLNKYPGGESPPKIYKIFSEVKKKIIKKIRNPYNTRKKWTGPEISYLRANYAYQETIRIARYLQRNYKSIDWMAYKLGLKKDPLTLSKINSKNGSKKPCIPIMKADSC